MRDNLCDTVGSPPRPPLLLKAFTERNVLSGLPTVPPDLRHLTGPELFTENRITMNNTGCGKQKRWRRGNRQGAFGLLLARQAGKHMLDPSVVSDQGRQMGCRHTTIHGEKSDVMAVSSLASQSQQEQPGRGKYLAKKNSAA